LREAPEKAANGGKEGDGVAPPRVVPGRDPAAKRWSVALHATEVNSPTEEGRAEIVAAPPRHHTRRSDGRAERASAEMSRAHELLHQEAAQQVPAAETTVDCRIDAEYAAWFFGTARHFFTAAFEI